MGYVTSDNIKEIATDAYKERSKDSGDKDVSSDGKESTACVSLPEEFSTENLVSVGPYPGYPYSPLLSKGPFEVFSF